MNTNQFGKEGWTPERLGNLSGKTYVITGTTSGTGFEAAKILLSKGAKVVMLNRKIAHAIHVSLRSARRMCDSFYAVRISLIFSFICVNQRDLRENIAFVLHSE